VFQRTARNAFAVVVDASRTASGSTFRSVVMSRDAMRRTRRPASEQIVAEPTVDDFVDAMSVMTL